MLDAQQSMCSIDLLSLYCEIWQRVAPALVLNLLVNLQLQPQSCVVMISGSITDLSIQSKYRKSLPAVSANKPFPLGKSESKRAALQTSSTNQTTEACTIAQLIAADLLVPTQTKTGPAIVKSRF